MSLDKIDKRAIQWEEIGQKSNFFRAKGVNGSAKQIVTDKKVQQSTFSRFFGTIARYTPGVTHLFTQKLVSTIKKTEKDIATLESRDSLSPAEKQKLATLLNNMKSSHSVLNSLRQQSGAFKGDALNKEIGKLGGLEKRLQQLQQKPDEHPSEDVKRKFSGGAPVVTDHPTKNPRNSFEKDGERWFKLDMLTDDGKMKNASAPFIQIAGSGWAPKTSAKRMDDFKASLKDNFSEAQCAGILTWVNQSQLGSNALQSDLLSKHGNTAIRGIVTVEDHFDIRQEHGQVAIRGTSLIQAKVMKEGKEVVEYHVVQNRITLDKDGNATKKEEWYSTPFTDQNLALGLMRQVIPVS